MVISLVNPHDVLFYPSRTFEEAGYDGTWLEGDIGVPGTTARTCRPSRPSRRSSCSIFNLTGKPEDEASKSAAT